MFYAYGDLDHALALVVMLGTGSRAVAQEIGLVKWQTPVGPEAVDGTKGTGGDLAPRPLTV